MTVNRLIGRLSSFIDHADGVNDRGHDGPYSYPRQSQHWRELIDAAKRDFDQLKKELANGPK